ncbi:MAG: acylneuraminate cytidylyltransferase family protein [Balneolaceae bacterium]|nr:acylneuraminate cytidylyltransferase family protein [Balneolaceae bacterium]
MNILSVVIARGGSKGIPRKNLADVGGIPLVAHIIKSALGVKTSTDLVLSTEDEEIAKIGLEFGAEVPFMRPQELAGDDVTSLPVVQHAVIQMENIKGYRYDIINYLQPTAPLCRTIDIENCLQKLKDNKEAESVVTIIESPVHPFKMKRVVDEDRVINFIDQGFEDMRPRQSLPKVYKRSGAVYASRRSVVMNQNSLVGEPCLGVIVPKETAVDIDTPEDLELVRLLYKKINLNK